MFCHKCGAQLPEGTTFCNKCGAKMGEGEATPQLQQPKTMQTQTGNTVAVNIGIIKVEGKIYAKLKSPVLVDDIQVGEVPNGETSSFQVTPGEHVFKIGSVSIGVNVPDSGEQISLKLRWGPNVTPEIICNQPQLVTKPSEMEKWSLKKLIQDSIKNGIPGIAGLVIAAIGCVIAAYAIIFKYLFSDAGIFYYYPDEFNPPFFTGIVIFAVGTVISLLAPKINGLFNK